MGFLKRAPGFRPDPEQATINQMRRAGADPEVPHQTRHFLYVPGVKAAQQLARALKRPDRRVEVETSARTGYWLVAVSQSMLVTPPAMAALRTELEDAAKPFGGEYDYWQVDIAAG